MKRKRLSVALILSVLVVGSALVSALGGATDNAPFQHRTGPIEAASLETSSFEMCDPEHPFDYRRVRQYFADALGKQDAGIARLTEKYEGFNPRRIRAPVKGGTDKRAQWREEIANDAWDLRFMVEGFMPFEHWPRAIHSWPGRLKSKSPTVEKGGGQLAQLKIAFLQRMFDVSPGSNDSSARYVQEVATLWSMSSPADPGSGTEPPALEDLLAQWQMILASYPAFRTAIEQTLDDQKFELAIWSNVQALCESD